MGTAKITVVQRVGANREELITALAQLPALIILYLGPRDCKLSKINIHMLLMHCIKLKWISVYSLL